MNLNSNIEIRISKADLIELLEDALTRWVLADDNMRVRGIEMHPQADKVMTITMGPTIPEPDRPETEVPEDHQPLE